MLSKVRYEVEQPAPIIPGLSDALLAHASAARSFWARQARRIGDSRLFAPRRVRAFQGWHSATASLPSRGRSRRPAPF
jgi:hypothetical protein